jgi:DNA-directed RNA polymerase specialized sigma subunit
MSRTIYVVDTLKDIQREREKINAHIATIERLQSAVERVTTAPRIGSRGTAVTDPMAESIAKVLEKQSKLMDMVLEIETLIADVEKYIEDVLPPKQSRILRLRYFEALTWEEVAEHAGFEMRWCFELHDRAIESLRGCMISTDIEHCNA